jgi:outer membrane protein assembly factor BamE (lipoprotein component of BamABCDE complex)
MKANVKVFRKEGIMRNFIRVLAVCFAITGAGCATVGRQFDTTHVNDIRKGAQDKAQIRAWFGEPYQTAPLQGNPAGCVERWQWTHAHSVAGGRTESQVLIVDFDAAGKVCDNAFSTVGG